jgi:hypothetical protein
MRTAEEPEMKTIGGLTVRSAEHLAWREHGEIIG